ncbi:MAG: LysE/ArgO family amino acid transporter [Candidatus Planktophila sp.]
MSAFIPGLLSGLSLIIAIGAQNAFVIRQGLTRKHVFLVVAICALSDIALIFLGAAGLGKLIQSAPSLMEFIRWFGVAYLLWFASKSLRSAFNQQNLEIGELQSPARTAVIASVLGFTFLNPHVYLDTVIFLGSLANQFDEHRWIFALGASTGSVLWFSAIGFGARSASKYMSKPIFWKVLDLSISVVMVTIALYLAFFNF